MENVQTFTRAGLYISKFYPEVRELGQLQNCDKKRNLSVNSIFTTFTYTQCLFNNYNNNKK